MSMQALLAANQSMAGMQAMQSAKTQMQSSANILRIESKRDGGSEKKLAVLEAVTFRLTAAQDEARRLRPLQHSRLLHNVHWHKQYLGGYRHEH